MISAKAYPTAVANGRSYWRTDLSALATISTELLNNTDCPSRIQNPDILFVETGCTFNPLAAAHASPALAQEPYTAWAYAKAPDTRLQWPELGPGFAHQASANPVTRDCFVRCHVAVSACRFTRSLIVILRHFTISTLG